MPRSQGYMHATQHQQSLKRTITYRETSIYDIIIHKYNRYGHLQISQCVTYPFLAHDHCKYMYMQS